MDRGNNSTMSAYGARHSLLDSCLYKSRAYVEMTTALKEFQQFLSLDQRTQFASSSNHAPTAEDVLQLTEKVALSNSSRKSRLFATRIQGLLGSVQQYCTVVDTCVGPNQIAALVWGSIKLVLLVLPSCYHSLSRKLTYLFVRFHRTLPNTLIS
jgi:hypothetical protein